MATLYDLGSQYNELLDMLESGEYTFDDLRDTIEMIDGEFDEKAVKLALVISTEKGESEKTKAQIDRLTALKKYRDNNVKRLKEYLLGQMQSVNKTTIKSTLAVISVTNSPEKIDEDDPRWGVKGQTFVEWAQKNNRDDLLTFHDPEPDKKAIKAALDAGEVLPASTRRDKSLRIR
jgi:hypothetical protein